MRISGFSLALRLRMHLKQGVPSCAIFPALAILCKCFAKEARPKHDAREHGEYSFCFLGRSVRVSADRRIPDLRPKASSTVPVSCRQRISFGDSGLGAWGLGCGD